MSAAADAAPLAAWPWHARRRSARAEQRAVHLHSKEHHGNGEEGSEDLRVGNPAHTRVRAAAPAAAGAAALGVEPGRARRRSASAGQRPAGLQNEKVEGDGVRREVRCRADLPLSS